MTVVKIDLEAPKQDFEIGGKVFEVYYDDENLKKREQLYPKMKKKYEKYKNLNLADLPAEEISQAEEDVNEAMKEIISAYFGEENFDFIYQAGGKSVYNMIKVVDVVRSKLDEKMGTSKAEKAKNYIK
ncbi:phage tail assembly chaperone [Bacillus subtilis]|uniref:phage tail assembly chaperone n=1 Tax=Bacillus subtilis TaxID=1423 RepID=UPI00059E72D3|nr:phage tail assembly chaperone [Bacillus subtilis]KIN42424.1 hypothetical protein B4070_4296 [Bacillus subtilis]